MEEKIKVTEVVNLKDFSYGMKIGDSWEEMWYLTPTQIIERFKGHLTEEQLKKLKNYEP